MLFPPDTLQRLQNSAKSAGDLLYSGRSDDFRSPVHTGSFFSGETNNAPVVSRCFSGNVLEFKNISKASAIIIIMNLARSLIDTSVVDRILQCCDHALLLFRTRPIDFH